MTGIEIVFWLSVCGIAYPYVLYPAILFVVGFARTVTDTAPNDTSLPTVSIIVPVHNEEPRIRRKVANTKALAYPPGCLEVIYVSDGSTDRTVDIIRAEGGPGVSVVELPVRGGKAAALNAGLARAKHEILVFTDASIALDIEALQHIVRPFADVRIGCVSGEDRIAETGGEAWYGRYELVLRRLESRIHSIVGASGSFYAQRSSLCSPFLEGQAPDFLSVLRTVELGYRAVTEPGAIGAMTSLKDPKDEFARKVRTLLRGMTTLFAHARLLNPWQFGLFSFALWSHKVMRWVAPAFLVAALVTPVFLLQSPLYAGLLLVQLGFYLTALMALKEWRGLERLLVAKVALYFSAVNVAALTAWLQYIRGVRQELWTPSRR